MGIFWMIIVDCCAETILESRTQFLSDMTENLFCSLNLSLRIQSTIIFEKGQSLENSFLYMNCHYQVACEIDFYHLCLKKRYARIYHNISQRLVFLQIYVQSKLEFETFHNARKEIKIKLFHEIKIVSMKKYL